MAYQSLSPEQRARFGASLEWGLIAATQVLINKVKREYRGGFKRHYDPPASGEATGNLINAVTRTQIDPEPPKTYVTDEGGTGVTPTALPVRTAVGREMRAGVNVLYGLFWELGWTPYVGAATASARVWEGIAPPLYRVPIWLPALRSERERMLAAFKRGYNRRMAQA